MIDQIKSNKSISVRSCCVVLGFRRQTYYRRKQGHRPEEKDQEIADLLHRVTKRFLAWGFWMVFHYLRKQGYPWNHKRVYRIWKAEGLNLRLPPKRPKIRRVYQDLLAPGRINEGWAMDVRHDAVYNIPDLIRRLLRRTYLSQLTYPNPKGSGEQSMLVKQRRENRYLNPVTARLAG